MEKTGRVAGKVAVITGGARGIGKACALRLAEEGADVALFDLVASVEGVHYKGASRDDLADATERVLATGRRVTAQSVDVRDERQLGEATAAVMKEFGQIDILVPAAGVDSKRLTWELTSTEWQAVIDVNLTGVWQTVKAVTPYMLPREAGSIVLMGSVLSHRPNRYSAHYTAAKHGVRGLARTLALELAHAKIRVNSVDPTSVATDMIMNQEYRDRVIGREGATMEESIAWHLEWNALPLPWLEPIDVANAVLFLASDEARYITGISLPVDAGALLK